MPYQLPICVSFCVNVHRVALVPSLLCVTFRQCISALLGLSLLRFSQLVPVSFAEVGLRLVNEGARQGPEENSVKGGRVLGEDSESRLPFVGEREKCRALTSDNSSSASLTVIWNSVGKTPLLDFLPATTTINTRLPSSGAGLLFGQRSERLATAAT